MRLSGRPTAGPPFEGRSGRLSSTGGAAAPRELRRGWEVGMALFDAYGRPVDTGLLKEEQAAATFSGIRNIYSIMHPSIGITPEKLNAILRQSELGDPYLFLELCEDMEEKDLHYLSVLSTRKQTVAQL